MDEVVQDRHFGFHTVDETGNPITQWRFTYRPDGDATFFAEGFERVALPDRDERAFEEELLGGRVQRNLANIASSLEALAALAEKS